MEKKLNPSAKWVYGRTEAWEQQNGNNTPTTSKYVIEFIWRYYVYIRLWMGERELLFWEPLSD